MTNEQLYLAIGVPIVANAAMLIIFWTALNKRIDDLRADMDRRFSELDKRFDRMEDLLRNHDRDIAALKDRRSPTGAR